MPFSVDFVVVFALIGAIEAQNDGLKYLDESVDPCDNFYQFACGNFKHYHEIPENKEVITNFDLVEEKLISLASEILTQPKSAQDPIAVRKAKSAYSSCISDDNPYLTNPELDIIKDIGGFPLIGLDENDRQLSWNDIGRLVGKYGIKLFFDIKAVQASQTMKYISFSLPSDETVSQFRPQDKSYDDILEDTFIKSLEQVGQTRVTLLKSKVTPLKSLFLKITKKLLETQPPSHLNIDKELDLVLSFSQKLYSGGIVDDNDAIDAYNANTFINISKLQTWTDVTFNKTVDINWKQFLDSFLHYSGVTASDDLSLYLNLYNIYGILNLVRQSNPSTVKNFIALRLFYFLAPDSDAKTREAFNEYYRATNGYSLPRWQYCARKILDIVDPVGLSFALAHDYQLYHVNINKLSEAAAMIEKLRETFRETLLDSDWMDYKSRDAALVKVDNINLLLGYPDFVADKSQLDRFYENLRICDWDRYGNAQRIRAFRQAYHYAMLSVDTKNYWTYPPMTVNSFYNKQNNHIYLPIAMLDDMFFTEDDPIFNFGRLGFTLGHEITHGFDSQGKMFDENGSINDWWTQETAEKFDRKKRCFENQYGGFLLEQYNYTVNGEATFNENLADNGGIRQAFKAFKKVLQSSDQIKHHHSNKYTPEQLFFINYANMFCSEHTANYVEKVKYSSYPLDIFRINGALSNFDEFSNVFQCPLGSAMNPENKCVLW